jgi:nucleoside 2-deoxyribosyltransferase
MNTAETIVYCTGPYWSPEEVQSLSEIARSLERAGFRTYLPHRDGIEGLAWQWIASPPTVQAETVLQKAVLALEVYQIVERCHALVFNMNGRVPDEGGVFKTALAFAIGKPLVIYKNDNRSTFHGNDNSMVTGLTPAFATIKRLAKLPVELAKVLNQISVSGERPINVPTHLSVTLKLGHKLWDLLEKHRAAGAAALYERIVALHDELSLIPYGHGSETSMRAI